MKHKTKLTDIWTDSRKVTPGSLFVSLAKNPADVIQHINQACTRGAKAIWYDKKLTLEITDIPTKNVSFIPMTTFQLKKETTRILKEYYPVSKQVKIVAITGTDGKTSTVHFCRELAGKLGYQSASIGTLGVFVTSRKSTKKFSTTSLTTPDQATLFQTLSHLSKNGIQFVFIEYSSIGIHQNRLAGIPIYGAIFTTFGKDHLDYHKTLTYYRSEKDRLFTSIVNKGGFSIVNSSIKHKKSIPYRSRFLFIPRPKTKLTPKGIAFKTRNAWVTTKLFASYLVENMNLAVAVCKELGIPRENIFRILPKINGPKGRFETTFSKKKTLAVIDYAHTPQGLTRFLSEIAQLQAQLGKARIISIMGAGGDRDKSKRPLFGKILSHYSDLTIITDDNPRTEHSPTIRKEIISGVPCQLLKNIREISPRENAIVYALNKASQNDIVLLIGKGHERYQITGTKKKPFNELSIVKNYKNT